MLVIGLTGGIGSGKSAAADCFAALGIKVIDADRVARDVVAPGQPALNTIAEHFGDDLIQTDGSLNRRRLRRIIFDDAADKSWLENLLHPLIRERIVQDLNNAQSPYVILMSPLLLETNQHLLCDRVLVIDADERLQISRASQRDNSDAEGIKKIIASQLPRDQRRAQADDIIDNDYDLSHLQRAVASLHQQYLNISKKKS